MLLLMSDVFPLLLFSFLFPASPVLFGVVASRVCSLVFHLFSETTPYLIHLDLAGIACMAFASLDACEAVDCPAVYNYAMALAFCAACCGFLHDLAHRAQVPRFGLLIALAAFGQFPTAFALCTGHASALALCSAAFAFGFGFFILEPRSHIAWHWAAAAGQLCALSAA